MKRCAWPRGCLQDAYEKELCYYHDKVVQGHIVADEHLFEAQSTRPDPSRRSELARLLASLGAPEEVISEVRDPTPSRRSWPQQAPAVRRGTLSLHVG